VINATLITRLTRSINRPSWSIQPEVLTNIRAWIRWLSRISDNWWEEGRDELAENRGKRFGFELNPRIPLSPRSRRPRLKSGNLCELDKDGDKISEL